MKLPITAIIAAKNEAVNIGRCIASLGPAEKIYVVDSHSTDNTANIASDKGAEVIQFDYKGGFPRKRQWALDSLRLTTPWIMLVDADESISDKLWNDICKAIDIDSFSAYSALKEFHFLGRKLRFGGFSHSAVFLFKKGTARFENLEISGFNDNCDMEVHERLIVTGRAGRLEHPITHNDFKSIDAYLAKHKNYAVWEAAVRNRYLTTGKWGGDSITPTILGDVQQMRRFLKQIVMRLPFEPAVWFAYHYFIRLGLFDGYRGFIAAKIRAGYIANVKRNMRSLTGK